MSSSSRPGPDRRLARTAALLLALVGTQWVGAPAARAALPLPVVAVPPGAQRTSVVVDLGAGTAPAGAVSVTLAGAPQQATVAPVVSDRMAVALVVDASAAGRAALPGWLSAAARFVLDAPSGARTAVVADRNPPAVVAPPQTDASAVVGALGTVRADGARGTAAALDLAVDQLPAAPPGNRLVVLYTTSADAGGEKAADLRDKLARSGTILVVVGAAADSGYWSGVSRATGGFFAPAGIPVVVPALDQVATTLRGRYVVSFPTPAHRPARMAISVDAGPLRMTGDAVVPADRGRAGVFGVGVGTVLAAILVAALLAAAAAVFVLRRRPAPAAPPPVVARGRAAVPRGLPPGSRPPRDMPPGGAPPGGAPPGGASPGGASPGGAPPGGAPPGDLPPPG
jgi:hypothetical protein